MKSHYGGNGHGMIKDAIQKHGRKNFVSVILLAKIEPKKDLDSAEMAVIDCLNSAFGKSGYNMKQDILIRLDKVALVGGESWAR